jgi:hypothetical protein
MHGTRGLIFGSVGALVTDTQGNFLFPRRSSDSKFFAKSLDYAVSGTMLTHTDDFGDDRPESAQQALLRESMEEGGKAFAEYVRTMIAHAPTILFAPDPASGLPFWERVTLLLGVPKDRLPLFTSREHDGQGTERVRFNDALDRVTEDQRSHPGKQGLLRAVKWATRDRVAALTSQMVAE